eukprot:m.318636 g.318636  ORF g.318636 m.318636 type:complete len:62 (+) comp55488_c0_seq15:1148-1333(+)
MHRSQIHFTPATKREATIAQQPTQRFLRGSLGFFRPKPNAGSIPATFFDPEGRAEPNGAPA